MAATLIANPGCNSMSYDLTEQERNAALQLNADYRYDHFISKVAQYQSLWILKDADGLKLLQAEDATCLPVWPHADYARTWAVDEWAGCEPQSITLPIWLERWVDGLTQDGLEVAVFPLREEMGIIESPAELADTLREKLAAQEE